MHKPIVLGGLRALGALSLLAVAAVHLYEYYSDHYSAIPTIGPLFALNGAGATALGLLLLAPVSTFLPRTAARQAIALVAVAGAALAATSLAALLISETRPLFGFMEVGYRAVVVAAVVSESVAVLVLTAVALLHWRLAERTPTAAAG